jgi:malate dehydrogenase (oxaloacetate-decarboxylating)
MDSSSSAESSAKAEVVETRLSGYDLLLHPGLNKGTAFTEEERDAFALHGLLPPHVDTLDEQLERRMKAFDSQTSSFERYTFMRDLQDLNEMLFYALITPERREVSADCVIRRRWAKAVNALVKRGVRPRGLFLSYPNKIESTRCLPTRGMTRRDAAW